MLCTVCFAEFYLSGKLPGTSRSNRVGGNALHNVRNIVTFVVTMLCNSDENCFLQK